jgi:hypothetical protein
MSKYITLSFTLYSFDCVWHLLEVESLSVEEILAETCADTLSDGSSNVLSDDDDSESYSDFEPEIARKIKTTVHLSAVIEKEEMPRIKTAAIKVRFMQLGGTATWQEQVTI